MNILLNLGADDWNYVSEAEEYFDGKCCGYIDRYVLFIDLWTSLNEQPSFYAYPMKYDYFFSI